MTTRLLRRSKTDRIISGVCGGIAATYGFDSVLVRGVLVVLAVMNLPLASLLYMAAYFFVPEESTPPSVPTQHPGWRFDPWTGDRINGSGADVIVDTAVPASAPAAQSEASAVADPVVAAASGENGESQTLAGYLAAGAAASVDPGAQNTGAVTADPAPDASPKTDSSPAAPSETDTRSAHTPPG